MMGNEQSTNILAHNVQTTTKITQLCSEQDNAYTGNGVNPHTGETYCYGIIVDGHGTHEIVDKINHILKNNIDTVLNSETPHLEIQSRLDSINRERSDSSETSVFYKKTRQYSESVSHSGGSTFLFTKIYENRIELFSVGDSEIYVMINNEIVYHNPVHKWSNKSEQDRLLRRNDVDINVSFRSIPHIISPERIGFAKNACVEYIDKNSNKLVTKLTPTQSLGHNSITQFAPEKMTIPVEPADTVKIVLASDGLWDVFAPHHPDDKTRLIEMDGEQLADLAEFRWKQEWEVAVDYFNPDVLYEEKSHYSANGYDDVAVITMVRIPLQTSEDFASSNV